MIMEAVDKLTTDMDPLLSCCMCKSLLQDPFHLTCLHNCCQRCFNDAASKRDNGDVTCNVCAVVTRVGMEQPNGFIYHKVQCYKAIAESRSCGFCKENDEPNQPALVWCPSCGQSLCARCSTLHTKLFRSHHTQSLEELQSLEQLCQPPAVVVCSVHNKPHEIACLNCERMKCLICWTGCQENKHEMHVAGDKSFDVYVSEIITAISSVEKELLRKSQVVENCDGILDEVKAARESHLNETSRRKKMIVDVVDKVYHSIECDIKNAYDDLEKRAEQALVTAHSVESKVSTARGYIHSLLESNNKCEILNQRRLLLRRLTDLSGEVDTFRDQLRMVGAIAIQSSLPENCEDVVTTWIGKLISHSSRLCPTTAALPPSPSHPRQLCFDACSADFRLPVHCADVALTTDSRLFLAAVRHGMIELSTSGYELSRWHPPELTGEDDEVTAVAALSDCRAAASLCIKQLVVVLKRNPAHNGVAPYSWTVDLRFDKLQSPPRRLSALGDTLAVANDNRLELMSVGNRDRLVTVLSRDYTIHSVAITAQAIFTLSWHAEEPESSRQLLDAHCRCECDVRLWRHEVDGDDEMWGIFADPVGEALYAAVCRRDNSTSRVSVISITDGCELQCFAFNYAGRMLPAWLSTNNSGDDGATTVLAVLWYDPSIDEQNIVTLQPLQLSQWNKS